MAPLSYFLLSVIAASFTMAIPTLSSATYNQNTIDAQILNSEFQGLNETDPCDSGQMACVSEGVAICRFGSWNITSCGQSNACFAVPSTTGPGTILTCTTKQDAQTVFQAAGAQGPLSNGTDTRAFPTVSTSSLSISPSGKSASHAPTQSSGVEVVTVTVTLPPPAFSTSLPPEVRTINPSEAASILLSLSAQGVTASPVSTAAASPAQVVGHCHNTTAEASPTSFVPSISTTTSSISTHAYYHKSRAARRT
ncbi:uncharacterized protein PHACADRAFT_172180 [Phanerochaete carnosa HHB-10118-sp]|uniref:Carbohydrate-binding module family 19 domain-containing protein n=1 Tax=Phanerochaete carnosa (strain HHB-10118-sp) TaxID=650164 RepID=K5WBY7_PHACS|nr:uncharacterized protein PHACADRAFT_172180 [Phanerochaete carnosa HHB-10118-sp]EKM56499.1 hypothetical protein PHACADRAFT_172180 [Phanerochaete carnosa HHB-10118-sp]